MRNGRMLVSRQNSKLFVDEFLATPSPTVESMGHDRMQNRMHLIIGLFSFFLLLWAHCNKDLCKGYVLSYILCI